MVFTTPFGFDNVSSEGGFAKWAHHRGIVNYKHGVSTGLAVTPTAVAREVSVSPGSAILTGVLGQASEAHTKVFASNGGTTNRLDILALVADWATNSVDLGVVQGASATVAPALTQVEGSLWQMPLARVTVRPGVTTFAAADIVPAAPLPRRTYLFKADVQTVQVGFSTSGVTAATKTIPDPGWPYILNIQTTVRVSGDAGYAAGRLTVNGTTVGRGFSGLLTTTNGKKQVTAIGASEILTGPATVELSMAQDAGVNGNPQNTIAGAASVVRIQQIPA